MRNETYLRYAAVTRDAAEHKSWTFYEAVKSISHIMIEVGPGHEKGLQLYQSQPLDFFGAGARNRTEMTARSGDFESPASTSFTTPAWRLIIYLHHKLSRKLY